MKAKYRLGYTNFHTFAWEKLMANILDDANKLVETSRQLDYGPPELHHSATAAMVTAYLGRRGLLAPGAALTTQDWQLMMILDKVVRHAGGWKRDNLVDIAGYARCAELCRPQVGPFEAP